MGNSKGTRNKIRRKLLQAIANLKTAQAYVVETGKEFETAYPLIYHHACNLVATLDQDIKLVDDFRDSI